MSFAALDFFAFMYPNRTADGEVLIAPAQALETYWCPFPFDWNPGGECVTGDAPTIATVTRLLERLLELPDATPPLVTPAQRAKWTELLGAMPPLPTNTTTGTLAPGIIYEAEKTHNSESVGLYSVHPARTFSVGLNLTQPGGVNLFLAAATYFADPYASGNNNGWHQVRIVRSARR